MIAAGGNGFKWIGNKIRALDDGTVSLPNRESYISIFSNAEKNSYYDITICGLNRGGNGKIEVAFYSNGLIADTKSVYIKSKHFVNYTVQLKIESNKNISLKISRTKDSSGNILIKSINSVKSTPPKTKKDIILEKSNKEKELKLKKQKEIGELQSVSDKQNRASDLQHILISRGEIMAKSTKIGGLTYGWRGYSLKTIFKFNATCAILPKENSTILIQANVRPNSKYKVVLAAAVDKNKYKLLVNFFGGVKIDGTHIPVEVISTSVKNYEIFVRTPNFPKNSTIYLRIFNVSKPTNGNVYIKSVEYTQVADKAKPKPIDKNIKKQFTKSEVEVLNEEVKKTETKTIKAKPGKNIPLDLNVMKFKPYESTLPRRDSVQDVLIGSADQVPKVSIITPTRDGAELIKKCYEALKTNTAYPNWEWIVGDSNSQDDTVKYLKELGDDRVKIIERGTTDGSFSSINNELVEYSTGEYLLFLNNDTQPQLFWLYEMMSKIIHNPNIGIVGARLMYNKNTIQHAGIVFVPEGPANLGKVLLKMMPPSFTEYDRYYHAVTGACLLMSKKDFKQIGGFDPIYYFCYEDVDLCLKVKFNLNKKVLYASNAIVLHEESITQKKYKTHGVKQQIGIAEFKRRWMNKPGIVDINKYRSDINYEIKPIDVSFITCVNNMRQYVNYVIGSLFKNETDKNYEVIPIFNFGNPYYASQALNMGLDKAKGKIVVLCHQDVIFYKRWVEMLFKRISEIEVKDKKWGVIGTAGINQKDNTIGVVHSLKGSMQWQSTVKSKYYSMQTVDEHCMIIRRKSGLRFDEKIFKGWHFYGIDVCMLALSKNMKNYGILCPIVHDSASGSLVSGRAEFMKYLQAFAKKWGTKFRVIRTPTSIVKNGRAKTFIKFKK